MVDLNIKNLPYFINHTKSPHLSKKDQKKALAASIVIGVFSAGVVHLICLCLKNRIKVEEDLDSSESAKKSQDAFHKVIPKKSSEEEASDIEEDTAEGSDGTSGKKMQPEEEAQLDAGKAGEKIEPAEAKRRVIELLNTKKTEEDLEWEKSFRGSKEDVLDKLEDDAVRAIYLSRLKNPQGFYAIVKNDDDTVIFYDPQKGASVPFDESVLEDQKYYIQACVIEEIDEEEDAEFIVALGGINQFSRGGASACTHVACAFLAQGADFQRNAASLTQFIQETEVYKDEAHENAEGYFPEFADRFKSHRQTPPEITDEGIELYGATGFDDLDNTMATVDIEGKPDKKGKAKFLDHNSSYERLLNFLVDEEKINGAIITGNGITVALRKASDGSFDFFDPHGANEITGLGTGAYLKRCNTVEEGVAYLRQKYFYIGDTPDEYQVQKLAVYPVTWR